MSLFFFIALICFSSCSILADQSAIKLIETHSSMPQVPIKFTDAKRSFNIKVAPSLNFELDENKSSTQVNLDKNDLNKTVPFKYNRPKMMFGLNTEIDLYILHLNYGFLSGIIDGRKIEMQNIGFGFNGSYKNDKGYVGFSLDYFLHYNSRQFLHVETLNDSRDYGDANFNLNYAQSFGFSVNSISDLTSFDYFYGFYHGNQLIFSDSFFINNRVESSYNILRFGFSKQLDTHQRVFANIDYFFYDEINLKSLKLNLTYEFNMFGEGFDEPN